MFEYSFYDNDNRKCRNEVIDFILTTDKPFKYTYGLKYRRPTTWLVPISRERAVEIFKTHSFVDVTEKDDYVDINAYSSNDMW